jgi:hypothetical protein
MEYVRVRLSEMPRRGVRVSWDIVEGVGARWSAESVAALKQQGGVWHIRFAYGWSSSKNRG